MKPGTTVLAPREMIQAKPPYGSPCNRCGLCCTVALCDLAQRVLDRPERPGPCPALRRTATGYECGAVTSPDLDLAHRSAAAILINADGGCDMRMHGEINANYAARMDARDEQRERNGLLPAARKLWGMTP